MLTVALPTKNDGFGGLTKAVYYAARSPRSAHAQSPRSNEVFRGFSSPHGVGAKNHLLRCWGGRPTSLFEEAWGGRWGGGVGVFLSDISDMT